MAELVPREYPLSGTDYFQFIFDSHTRKRQPVGNVIRIQLDFNQEINTEDLRELANTNDSFLHISSIRLNPNGLFQIPHWALTKKGKSISIDEHVLTEDEF